MAREKMTLPSEEIALLCGLSATAQRARARQLYDAGWSLSSIGEALSPPRSRSTVRAWTQTAPLSLTHSLPSPPLPLSSLSSAASSSTIGTAEKVNPAAPIHAHAHARRRPHRMFDPSRPNVSPDDAQRIAELAPLARRYRARANPNGAYALANEELTQLCCSLYDQGVSIRELAHSAGVTYKAMERRVKPNS